MNSAGRKRGPYSQAQRLIAMLRLLSVEKCSVDELVERFEVCKRQVYRDLRVLEFAGCELRQTGDLFSLRRL